MPKQLIRFDWAIKKLLRDKANFDILEGFLTVLLSQQVTIEQVLDSESNKETDTDRHNRVDLLARDSKGELIIIEVQNSKEFDYFHRMVYGTSKVISEHIQQGESYSKIKKVIAVTIAYFDLGQGEDYVYHGKQNFQGIHHHDILQLADKQKELYNKSAVHEIFPEYWIIKAEKFDNTISDKLDEWIYFLKNSEILDTFTAPGLDGAKEKLNEINMGEEERTQYGHYLTRLRDIASDQYNRKIEIEMEIDEALLEREEKGRQEGRQEGEEKGRKVEKLEMAAKMLEQGFDNAMISQLTGLPQEEIEQLRK